MSTTVYARVWNRCGRGSTALSAVCEQPPIRRAAGLSELKALSGRPLVAISLSPLRDFV